MGWSQTEMSEWFMLALSLFSLVLLVTQNGKAAADSSSGLDQARIHSAYNDGNFDLVVRELEGYQNQHPDYGFNDSVFIAKHLAVVYTANPATREKGKYYMYRLLELLPSARLIDMYVSDEIDRIFDRVKEEFAERQKNFGVEPAPAVASKPAEPVKAASAPKARREKDYTPYWIAGGIGAAAIGATLAYFLLAPTSEPEDKIYEVP